MPPPRTPSLGYLLFPARVFIGAGWLRAAAEKLRDPAWFTGGTVRAYLTSHRGVGFLGELLDSLFLGLLASPTAAVVFALQLTIGLGILLGLETSANVVVGIGLNTIFLLGGEPNPSVFYIVIQLLLLWGGAGSYLSLDCRLQQNSDRWTPAVSADPAVWTDGREGRIMMFVSLGLVLLSAPFIQTLEPAAVIDDPAAVGSFCALLAALPYGIHRWQARAESRTQPAVLESRALVKPLTGEARAELEQRAAGTSSARR